MSTGGIKQENTMNHSFFTTNPFLGIQVQKVASKVDSRTITVRHFSALKQEVACVLGGMIFCHFC